LRDRARAAKKGCFFMRYRWFESISLQRRVGANLASSPCCRGRRDRRHPQSLGHRTGTRRVEQRLRSRAGLRCDEPERPPARSPAAATSAGNAGIAGRRDRSCFISLCPESRDVLNRGPTNFFNRVDHGIKPNGDRVNIGTHPSHRSFPFLTVFR
jgi:hypothetical protein